MHHFVYPATLLSLLVLCPADGGSLRLHSIAELNAIRRSGEVPGESFTATGTVQRVNASKWHVLSDKTDRATILFLTDPGIKPGDKVEFVSHKEISASGRKILVGERVTPLGAENIDPPETICLSDLDERLHDLALVSTEGDVVDVTDDKIDANYSVLILKDESTTLPVFFKNEPDLTSLEGARIRVTGIYERLVMGQRHFSGPFLSSSRSEIEILKPPPDDPFDVPAIDPSDYLTPATIARMGKRSVVGIVLASWNTNTMLVRVGKQTITAELSPAHLLPPNGTVVKITGYPQTDLFQLNLVRARWKAISSHMNYMADVPECVTARSLFCDENGRRHINGRFQGTLIRLSGIVRGIPAATETERRLSLDADGYRISVDLSTFPSFPAELAIGGKVEITGYCCLETDRWTAYNVFPQIKSLFIVLRSPRDITILVRPPWWTSKRLLCVIAALLMALIGFAIWNRILKRMIDRRGRELYRAELAEASSRLRIDERTRLAVELHDTLSQNLTGIALQINAGAYALAQRTLKSCREELKNCLWDLRNETLDEADMNEAIRRTLAPHIGTADLLIRFNVPRSRLTDNTAHALLRIIRELAVNAIRHGKASTLKIAGSIEDQKLLVSVRDNGCGFDTPQAPGPDDGHFGLQGIRERIETFEGEMEIWSKLGQGTRVMFSLGTNNDGKETVRP